MTEICVFRKYISARECLNTLLRLICKSLGSAVGRVTGGLRSRSRAGRFKNGHCSIPYRLALPFTQLVLGVKRLVREADPSPPTEQRSRKRRPIHPLPLFR
jgi:hypothetical protein